MADSVFPWKKRSLFVKTYSKVQPLQTFTPTVKPGKPFPFDLHLATVAPTLAPANSPSSDSSCSDTHDVEMISSEVIEPSSTEDEDEKSFLTLTPGSKNISCSKKQRKKKLCKPLQNISNVIKAIHSSKAVSKCTGSPKRTASPFLQTCSKVQPRGQLPSIQESDQESSCSDGQEGTRAIPDKLKTTAAKKKQDRIYHPSKVRQDGGTLDCQDTGGGVLKITHLQSKIRDKNSPMVVQGRGVLNTNSRSTLDERSTHLYGSSVGTEELSTATYTRHTESDDSTLMTSDTCTDGQYSTTLSDTFKDEDFSDIEIPRDFPAEPTARVMKQLTPNVAQLILPDAVVRATPKKTSISTVKAMPRKYSSAWHNKKPTVTRAKNSTLIESISALNIKEYGPIDDISEIQEENFRPDLVSSKITSTPTSKDRNTVVHRRFIPDDMSSIEGDACALLSIDALQSWSSTGLDGSIMKASTSQNPGVKPISVLVQPHVPHPTAVCSLSASSTNSATPLNIKGRKALTRDKPSPRMSSRVSFGQYPNTTATKSSSSVNVIKCTPGISAGNTSSSSSSKHVKFLLSHKAREVLPDEPDSRISCSVINLPELSPSCSILKKRDNTTLESTALKIGDQTSSSNKETKRTGRARMTSTPQRSSRRTKGVHMLALSFDVSAVDLPSYSEHDLVTQPSTQYETKTLPQVANQKEAVTRQGQSTQEPMDSEPIPMQVSTSVTSEIAHPARGTQKDQQTDTQGHVTSDQGQTDGAQHQEHVSEVHGNLSEIHDPVRGTNTQGSLQDTHHPVFTPLAHDDQQEMGPPATHDHTSLHEAQHPVHATPRAQLKRSSPTGDLPGRPNKKRFLEKEKSVSAIECSSPQTCDRGTQKNFSKQKRLEYVDKASGLPECIIARLCPTLVKPARLWQYVNNVDVMDYERIKNMPQDVLETIPDAVFS